MKEDRILRIYTDGGCAGNQSDENLGGWGAILEFGSATKELYGSEKNTTNNRMEMTALLEALRAVKKENQEIHVFSDSSYLMDCFRKKWYVYWQKNGWKTASKKAGGKSGSLEGAAALYRHPPHDLYRVKGHVNLDSPSTNTDKALCQVRRGGTAPGSPTTTSSTSRKKTTEPMSWLTRASTASGNLSESKISAGIS